MKHGHVCRASVKPPNLEATSGARIGIEQGSGKWIDEMGLDLVADSSTAVGHIRKAQVFERVADSSVERDIDSLCGIHVTEHAVHHPVEDLARDIGTNEVEDEYVVADPIQDFGPIEHNLEVALDLASHAHLDFGVCVIRRHVRDA